MFFGEVQEAFSIHVCEIDFLVQLVAEVDVRKVLDGDLNDFGRDFHTIDVVEVMLGEAQGGFTGAETDRKDVCGV